jgi:hypothetical protein
MAFITVDNKGYTSLYSNATLIRNVSMEINKQYFIVVDIELF